jgi:hypothetical protein
MPEQTKRIEALDIAKGIGIILVIIGHMSSSYLRDWIYSFHMPLFFILSGICFKTEKYPSFLPFLRQRVRTLAIPTLALYFIILLLETLTGIKGFDLQQQLKGVHPGVLWFLITLLFSELLYFPLSKLTVLWRIPLLFVLVSTGVFFARNHITAFFDLTNIFFSTALYGLGNLFSSSIPSALEHIKQLNKYIIISSTTVAFVIPLLLITTYKEAFDLASNFIPSPVVLYTLSAVTCTFAVITLSTIIPFQKLLKFFGRNTLILLAFHPLIIAISSTQIAPYFHSHLVYKVIELGLVFSGSCAFIPIFNRYIPWAIGKRK